MDVVTVFHVSICVLLILIVLLQQGKGADMGATFGGGGGTVFGAAGADTILTKVTTVIALLFMVTSIYLAIESKEGRNSTGSLFQNEHEKIAPATETEAVPAEAEGTVESEPAAAAAPVSEKSTPPTAEEAPPVSEVPAEETKAAE